MTDMAPPRDPPTCRGCRVLLTEDNARVVHRTRDGSPAFTGACRPCESTEASARAARRRASEE